MKLIRLLVLLAVLFVALLSTGISASGDVIDPGGWQHVTDGRADVIDPGGW